MADDSIFYKDIMGEKGHRYKRVVLALSFIVIGLSLVPGLRYDKLGFFGISPPGEHLQGKIIVFFVLWLLLAYHAFFLALHAYEDWRDCARSAALA